jgi:hypothetical protein
VCVDVEVAFDGATTDAIAVNIAVALAQDSSTFSPLNVRPRLILMLLMI